MSKKELISALEEIYGKDRFDFSLVPEKFKETYAITLKCKIHNEQFKESPKALLNGHIHCPSCNKLDSNYYIEITKKKYNRLSDLFLNCRNLYKKLKKENLLKIYYPNDFHDKSFWTFETCRDVSKPFSKYTDFFICYPEAFEEAYFNEWLESYTWLTDKTLGAREPFWTFERVKRLLEIKQYKSFAELKLDSYGATTAIYRHIEWKDLLPIEKKEANKFIDKDTCYKIALKCKTLKEMRRISTTAAKRAVENGWINDYTWFKEHEELEDMRFCVYLYTDGIAAYVGITRKFRLKIRHKEHNAKKHGKIDSVKEYFNSKNEKIPEPIVLEKDLKAEDALYYENYYIEKYRKEGYIILNKAKTGIGTSSLGNGFSKNTKDYCESIARKYTTLNDFYHNEPKIYDAAHQQGWLKDYTWLKRQRQYNGRHYWTYEEVKTEAEKYEYLCDFQKYSSNAHASAVWNGWIKDFTWLKLSEKYVSYEEAYEEAMKYEYVKDFSKNSFRQYQASYRKGWLKDFTWLKRKKRCYCIYEEVKTEAEKYEYLYDFIHNSSKDYNAAIRHGWLKDFTWLKRDKPKEKINPTKEECFETAKRYDKVRPFSCKCPTIYYYARSMGWLDDYIWFKGIYNRWTFNRCKEEARKYKTLKEFEENCYGGYHVSVKEDWISKFDWLA